MKYIYLAILLALLPAAALAQGRSVMYDPEKNWFDNGQDLPSGDNWILTGAADNSVSMVQVEIYKNGEGKGKAAYRNQWRNHGSESGLFTVPIQYALSSNSNYAIRIQYFRTLDAAEKLTLQAQIVEHSMAFLRNNVEIEKKKLELRTKASNVVEGLEKVVAMHLSTLHLKKIVYSEMIERAIDNLDKHSLKELEYRYDPKVDATLPQMRMRYFEELMANIRKQISLELKTYLASTIPMQTEDFLVTDYPTEKVPGALNIDLGYAGIYNSGNLSSLSYAAAPYAGLSFPLWRTRSSDLSISTGVFLTNLDFDDGNGTVTGPVIGRPIYAGVSYRLLRVVRLSGGAAALQSSSTSGGASFSSVYLRPYLGIGLALSVSAGHR